jgi:hypothetical protein
VNFLCIASNVVSRYMNPKANPKHPKAAKFVKLFRNLKSFPELENRISKRKDNDEKGAAFEVFAEAYLATQKNDVDPEQLWPQGVEPSASKESFGCLVSTSSPYPRWVQANAQFGAIRVTKHTLRALRRRGPGKSRQASLRLLHPA